MADDQTIARIQAFIDAEDGDFTIRRGSGEVSDPTEKYFTGEISTSNFDFVIGENGIGQPTLAEALDQQIGRRGGA